MTYTLETKIGTLLDDPRVKLIVERKMPGATTNPMLAMVKGMTINAILAMPQAANMGFTKEKAEALLAEVNKEIG